jgi:hypothetical protein
MPCCAADGAADAPNSASDAGHQDRGFQPVAEHGIESSGYADAALRCGRRGKFNAERDGEAARRARSAQAAQELGRRQALAAGLLQFGQRSAPSPQATTMPSAPAQQDSPGTPLASKPARRATA